MAEPSFNSADSWLQGLAEEMQTAITADSAPNPTELTVRQFLGRFGYFRRGANVISEIRSALEIYRLRTNPDFEYEYVDNYISIELDLDIEEINADRSLSDPTIRIGVLPAAHNTPLGVSPSDPLDKATTLMRMEDYSQLPVMNGERTVKGIVSWRSIGEAYADERHPKVVKDCMEDAHEVSSNMMLARIAHHRGGEL